MCKVKVRINIDIFDDEEIGSNCQNRAYEPIRVEGASDDISSALISAIYEALIVLKSNGHQLPSKGVRSHQETESLLARRARKLFLYQNDSDSDRD